jgi:hypothetical protein
MTFDERSFGVTKILLLRSLLDRKHRLLTALLVVALLVVSLPILITQPPLP